LAPGIADAGCQFVHHAVLDAQYTAQWPRQTGVQARAKHLYRFAEALVDTAPLQRDFVDPGQQPADGGDQRQHRQKSAAHVAERPDLAQIDAETVVQFVLQSE
jgi:hypothetical protein